jgi:hypothetical protein
MARHDSTVGRCAPGSGWRVSTLHRWALSPQCGNSPDSDRPPAETAPGGRPDTTAPVRSAAADAAAAALQELFLANADRGDNAANDELVAELVCRIRAQQGSSDGGRSQHAAEPPGWLEADG